MEPIESSNLQHQDEPQTHAPHPPTSPVQSCDVSAAESGSDILPPYPMIAVRDLDGYTYGQRVAPIVAAMRAADENRAIDDLGKPYRLAGELRKPRTDTDYFGYITPVDSDISNLIGCFEGPLYTPYQGGIFFLSIEIPPEYPFKPSKVSFLTKVYHPNVCFNGAIHADIFGGFWSPAITLEVLLLSVSGLLSEPNPDESIEPEIANTCKNDRSLYDATAKRYTALYATADQVLVHEPRVWRG
ncbi:UBC-like protein [Wilcoxina mikolae CBS 423.85]|nr:UBC-like protein [Wilcoxina mikolae CBS 423.85]